ncbi:MAG: hypothetical protein LBU14_06425 [Candidatus Peribacteria bacterium]|jgi:hypothetical protein|nr:hypothetical protein [Candidatus Peribacteria bacterium]
MLYIDTQHIDDDMLHENMLSVTVLLVIIVIIIVGENELIDGIKVLMVEKIGTADMGEVWLIHRIIKIQLKKIKRILLTR